MIEKEKSIGDADALKEKANPKKKTNKNVVTEEEKMEGRLTGYQLFGNKGSGLDALEKAAEDAAAAADNDMDVEDFDEDLFDEDSDEDLDDLDFDSDDDIDDEEIDI